MPEWTFLRSFAALEALFDAPTVSLDQVKSSLKDPAKAPPEPSAPVGVSLDELYGDVPAVAAVGGLAGPPPETAMPPTPKRYKMGKDRMDPFETFEGYVNGTIEPAKPEPDTFDFLGSQLGI